MRRLGSVAMAAVFAIGSVFISSPANAAGSSASRDGMHIYFNVSPEPVKKCGNVLGLRPDGGAQRQIL
jgi:hypothetical protein